jgi:diguanylate cyclase (GGDEF)-like protein
MAKMRCVDLALSDIISLIFLMTSAVYFFFGLLVLSYNSRSALHRLLCLSFLCLSWWGFAFTVVNTAPDHETALFWRRLAAAGWGIYFSLFLHFILLLTERNALLQKYWLYLFLYLPALINVFLYGIYDQTALRAYNLVQTPAGWVNMAGILTLDLAFLVHYIGFTLAGLVLLLTWGMNDRERIKGKIARIIGYSILAALIMGTLTEHAINEIFQISFPQLGPITILIPAVAMFYCIRRYGMMRRLPKDMEPSEYQMLSEYAQSKLYFYLAMGLFFGGFVSFAALFLTNRASLAFAMVFSSVFMIAGIIIYIIRSLNLKPDLKDTIIGIILAATLPVLTVLIYEFTASHSWTLPVIFVLIMIIFSNKKIIALMGIAVLFSLIWSWIKIPVLQVTFTGADHLIRMVVLAVMIGYVYYINHVFRKAITENKVRADREKFLSDVASLLMTISDSDIDEKIRLVLAWCGKHLQVECVHAFFLDSDQITLKNSYHWCSPGNKSALFTSASNKAEVFAFLTGISPFWCKEHFATAEVTPITRNETKDQWTEKINAGALTVIPLKNADKILGLVAMERPANKVRWQEDKQETCHVVARMIANVWLKVEAEKKVQHKAYHDSLTGLPNRQHFIDRLKQAINMAMRTDKLVGVLFIDVDSFKHINDSMGHAAGDVLLKQMGQRMKESVREYDVVGRFGGDEFLIIVPQADDMAGIERVAAKVLENLKEPMAVEGQRCLISVSMGIAVFPMDGEDPEGLIKNADMAMYVSKEIGKNRYAFCTAKIKNDAYLNMALINDLQWALERKELYLHYQPQLKMATKEIIGAEALLRWQHPRLGKISPGVFIPLAEKSGQIGNIGAWTISQACHQNMAWQEAGLQPVTMAVNLSLGQFLDANLVEVVQNALEKSGLRPEFLELEITEGMTTHEMQNISNAIYRLKALGVKIAIDDFGSGYSYLERFKNMPVDKIKIDMRFVHGIGSNNKDEEIIKVILQLGKTFGIRVLAEGVEEEKQFLFLKENLCDEIQGYYCFYPMPAGEMEKVLPKHPGK